MSSGRGIGPWSSRLRGASTRCRDLVETLLRAQRAAGIADTVQLLDETVVHEAVHPRDDSRRSPGPRVVGLAPDTRHEPVASRTAAVATATMRGARPSEAWRETKRRTARSVSSIASRDSVPGAPSPNRVPRAPAQARGSRHPSRPNPLLRRALASACKGPQDPRVEEPDEPSRARKTVGEVHQRGAALLEPEPIAVGDAQEPREEGGKQRLVADQRHRRGRAM